MTSFRSDVNKAEISSDKLVSAFSFEEIMQMIKDTKAEYLPSAHGPLNYLRSLIISKAAQRKE